MHPLEHAPVHDGQKPARRMDEDAVILAARFKQQHAVARIFRQSPGKDAPR
jgi:hypothetical protein